MGVQDRKARDFQRREADILAAALQLSKERDWQSITISEIAEWAEIGKGTIYTHFKRKEEVYARLVANRERQLFEQMERIDPKLPLLARFKEVLRIYLLHEREYAENRGLEVFHQSMKSNPDPESPATQEYTQLEGAILNLIAGMLLEGVQSGEFADKPIYHLGCSMWGAVIGSLGLLGKFPFQDMDVDEFMEDHLEFILKGLTNPESAPSGD